MTAMTGDELRGYGRGYTAGRRNGETRAEAATYLFGCLVDGLVASGVSIDAILDLQIAGAKARQ